MALSAAADRTVACACLNVRIVLAAPLGDAAGAQRHRIKIYAGGSGVIDLAVDLIRRRCGQARAMKSLRQMVVDRAREVQRFLSQPFNVGEVFTGLKGVTVPVADTVESFAQLVEGDLDDLPEQAFLNVGDADSVRAKAQQLQEG